MIGTYSKQSQLEGDYIRTRRRTVLKKYNAHCHEFFELEYILSGSGEYIVNGKRTEIRPGPFFFMTPADFHSVIPNNVEIYNVMFSGDICNSAFLSVCIDRAAGGSFEPVDADEHFLKRCFQSFQKTAITLNMPRHYWIAYLQKSTARLNLVVPFHFRH